MAKKRARSVKPRREDSAELSCAEDDVPPDDAKAPAKKPAKKKATKKKATKKRRTPPEEVNDIDAESPERVPKKKARRVHSYDETARKSAGKKKPRRSKKAQRSLDEWKGKNRGKKRDAYFTSLANTAKAKFGNESVLAGSEANSLVVGIPMPSLALEWLLQQDVLPLSQVTMLAGWWGTCKSALLYEMFRWFSKFNGGAILLENETKFSPDLCSSIMGYSRDECPVIVNRCHSMNEWQERLTFYIQQQKTQMIGTLENPGPQRTIPIAFAVDSLMGKASDEKIGKIRKEGSASRDFPIEAQLLTQYMRAMAAEFDNWPFALLLVNHLTKGMDGEGDQTAGANFASFQESFEIRTELWQSHLTATDFDGKGVRLRCAKNSFGQTGRSILTRMLWWDEHDEESDEYVQQTVWDWDWATVTMLNNLPDKWKAKLKEHDINLSVKSPKAVVDPQACLPALGMGRNEMLHFREVGEMIRTDPEVSDRIRTALCIKRRSLMEGDYLEQLDELKETLE